MASPPRVLICDDAAGFRLLTRTVLADAGFDVIGAAEDWDEAIAMATDGQPDAIVLDLWLPTFDRTRVEAVRAPAPARARTRAPICGWRCRRRRTCARPRRSSSQ